jgi:PAS domain S-box-containing protein
MKTDFEFAIQNQSDLKNLLLNMNLAGWVWDIRLGKVSWSNERYQHFGEDISSYNPSYENYLSHFSEDEKQRTDNVIQQAISTGSKFTLEHEIIRGDGTPCFIREFGQVILDDNHKPFKMVGFSQDISESKQKENELKIVLRLYSLLSSINQSIVQSKNQQTLFESICKIATDIGLFRMAWIGLLDKETGKVVPFIHTGYEEGYLKAIQVKIGNEALGKGPTGLAIDTGIVQVCNDIVNESAMLPWRPHALQRGYRSSAAIPFIVNGKVAGTISLYSGEPGFFSSNEKELLTEVGRTISFGLNAMETEEKRRLAEINLRKLSRAVEQSPVSIVITDLNGSIEYVNPNFEKITGYKSEEAIGQNPRILKSDHTSPGEYANLWSKIIAGGEWRGEFHNKRKDGSLFWEEARISPIVNDEGVITNFLAVKEDITERKLIEEEKTKLLGDILSKNKNLEEFAYIVSHSLRAPVANILGLKNILKTIEITEEERKIFLDEISNEVERLDSVIIDLNKILHLNNQANEKKENINIHELIAEIKRSLDYSLKRNEAELNLNFENAEIFLSVRPLLYSIFFNLITNSLKFRKPELAPRISITGKKDEQKYIFTYEDNGTGIDMELHGKEVFGLYKQFHKNLSGKGLGLFMVKKNVENLNGNISVESSSGKGVKFTMEFYL